MPRTRIDDTLEMHYELDDYTDPWTTPETILLVHGVADTSKAWFAWVPLLARRFRVLRPDLRGFGQSSLPPPGYPWSVAGLARDLKGLLDHLLIAAVHVVGQRVGGSVAMQFAHDYPAVTSELPASVAGPPMTTRLLVRVSRRRRALLGRPLGRPGRQRSDEPQRRRGAVFGQRRSEMICRARQDQETGVGNARLPATHRLHRGQRPSVAGDDQGRGLDARQDPREISPSASSDPRPWTLLLVELQRRAQRQLLRRGPTSPPYVARYTSDRICRDSSDPL